METAQLQQLKTLLQAFHDSDILGMDCMEEIETVRGVIDLIDGAIINNDND